MIVNTDGMSGIATNFKTISNKIDTIIEDISTTNNSIGLNWTGPAATEYTKNLLNSLTALKSYSLELSSSANLIKQTIGELEEIEKTNVELINNAFTSNSDN